MRATAEPEAGAVPARPAPPDPALELTASLRSILRNSSVLIGSQVMATLVAMGLMVILSRALGDAEFGRLHLALSLTVIVGVAVEFGLTQVLARAVAREPASARPYLRRALLVVVTLGALLYAGLLGGIRLLGYPVEVNALVAILGILMVGEALAQVLSAVFQAHERMLVPALARVAGNLFLLAAAVPLLAAGQRAPAIALMMVLAAFLRVAIQAVAVSRLAGFRATPAETPSWRALLVTGMPFLLAQALGMIVFRVNVLMLGHMTSDATVGWYATASRLMEAFNFLPQLLTAAAFPVAARLWVTARPEFQGTMQKTLHLLLVVTVPVSVTLLVQAEHVIAFLFTLEGYARSVPILRIHALSLALVFVDYYLAGILMAVGRERTWLGILGVATAVNVGLNWLLIPLADGRLANGGIGAAAATLLTEVLILGLALRGVPREAFGRQSVRAMRGAAALGALLGAFLLFAGAAGAPWLLAAVVGGAGYLALVVRLGVLPGDMAAWARDVVMRRRAAAGAGSARAA